jgi:hypothetical protein
MTIRVMGREYKVRKVTPKDFILRRVR